jgi:hypothetical protein
MLWRAMAGGTIRSESGLRRIAFAAMALASHALYDAGVPALHQDRTSVAAHLMGAGS